MGFLVKGVKSVIKAVVGITSKVIGGIFGFVVGGSKKTKKATGGENLNKSLEPEAYRKIVFGRVAAPLDVRFWQVWGTGGTKFDEVIALASHRINAVLELWFEDKLGINSSNAASGSYIGSVTRSFVLGTVGQAALNVGGGTQYTSTATFDGCAAMVLSWLPDEKKLPDGIPGRYTQIIEGALVYDPRRDSTQPGGSGTHRANDRSTWAYATLDANGQPIGRNNALQSLWYLLGWYIPTKDAAGNVTGDALVCGRGVDPQDINMATFIAGANNCEVAAYYTDMVLSTEDDHVSNENKITCDGLIGRIIDPGGLWSYYANVNDTANIAVELTDKDILESGSLSWDEFKGMSEQYNQVGGKFVNPSNITLYQPFPYPLVRDAAYETALGVKRRKTQDFPQILDNTLAQRLARLFLNQGQYQGELSANFMSRAIRAQAWSVVRYSSERFGWTKLFRVWRHEISTEGGVGMLLKEIDASIWSAGTVTPPVAPGLAVPYNGLQEIAATGVTVTLVPMTGAGGTLADGFAVTWAVPPVNVRRTELRYRLVNTGTWLTAGPVERDVTGITIGPLLSGAIYETAVRHISVSEIAGPWVIPNAPPANGSGQFTLGVTGNVNYAEIAAAGGTANWAEIIGIGKPEDFATRNEDGANMIPSPILLDRVVLAGALTVINDAGNGAGRPATHGKRVYLYNDNSVVKWESSPTAIVAYPGETLFASYAAGNNNSVQTTDYLELVWQAFYASGAQIAEATIVGTTMTGSEITAIGGVVTKRGSFVTPAGTASVLIYTVRRGSAQNSFFYVAEPYLGRQEQGSDKTLIIQPPSASKVFKYGSNGVAESGEFNRDFLFRLMSLTGEITSGITWTYKVLAGGFNGTIIGNTGTIGSGGAATLPVINLLSAENVIEIIASYQGKVSNYIFEPIKEISNPDGGIVVSKGSGFNGPANSTYTSTTGTLTGTLFAGKTSAVINVSLDAMPASGITGNWTIEMQVQRFISGTWTNIGSTQSANSLWNSNDVSGDQASFNFNISDTGLTGGTSYDWRVVSRVVGTARGHFVTGYVAVTA